MADISKITLPSGSTYNIKDEYARDLIKELGNYTEYLGVTTTALTEGATTNPISIAGTNKTAAKGNIATYQSAEFIFNGTEWQKFGDLSGLGSLAYKSSASGSYTPSGSVSQSTFTGIAHNHTATFTGTQHKHDATFTGTAHNHGASFKGTAATITPTITANEDAQTKNYTPKGTVGIDIYRANPGGTLTKDDSFKLSSDGSYTPNVSVNTQVTYHKNEQTFTKINSYGTLPSLTTTVSNETLTIGFSQGSLPTGTDKTINGIGVNGISATSTETSQKVFIVPTFAGTGVGLTASASYTPAGSVTVNNATASGSVSVVNATAGGSVSVANATAGGTVSQPTFTGTAKTVTVS